MKQIIQFFGKTRNKQQLEMAAINCPNCWGKKQENNRFIQFTKWNYTHNRKNNKAFIQKFVETNITGIRLT